MTQQTPLDVTTAYFDALAQGDVAAALALLSPDVRWHQPGAHRFSGTHSGPEAVAALIGGMMQVSEGTFELGVTAAPMVNGDHVAYPVRFTARRDGQVLDMEGVDLLTVADGRITEVHLFSADGPVEDRFWGAA